MDIDTAATTTPAELRNVMVDRFRDCRLVSMASVEAAMRAVPRHLFVPDATVERAYSNEAVVTHRDADGVAVSSSSAPGVVAGMDGFCRLLAGSQAVERGLVAPAFGWGSMGCSTRARSPTSPEARPAKQTVPSDLGMSWGSARTDLAARNWRIGSLTESGPGSMTASR